MGSKNKNVTLFKLANRVLGYQQEQAFFESVRALGKGALADDMYALFKAAVFHRCKSSIETYKKRAMEELLPLIQQMEGPERIACEDNFEFFYNAVTWSEPITVGGKQVSALAGLRAALKSGSVARTSAAYRKLVRQVQLAAIAEMAPAENEALRLAMEKFEKGLSLASQELMAGVADIIENRDNVFLRYINRDEMPKEWAGVVSRMKGPAFERWIYRDPRWKAMRNLRMDEAGDLISSLPGEWEVIEAKGKIWVYFGGEGWKQGPDWGVYGALREKGEYGTLFAVSEMEAKAARLSEGIDQSIKRSYLQPSSWDRSKSSTEKPDQLAGIPTLIRIGDDANSPAFRLVPRVDGKPTYRYLVNTEGARIPGSDKTRLTSSGIKVEELQLAMTAKEFGLIFDSYIEAMLKVMGYI